MLALRRAYACRRPTPLGATAERWLVVSLTLAAVAAWLVLLAVLVPRLFYGSDSLRTLEAVTGGRDEAYVAGSTWGIWLHGPFTLSTLYGDLYFLLGWLVLHIYAIFKAPTEHVAIVVLRSISLVSYVAFGTGMYFWVKRCFGPVAGVVALLLVASLAANDEFAWRATACQSDMLNLAVTALAMILIVEGLRKPTLRSTIAVGAAVGAVMAVKLSAMFIALLAVGALLVWSVSESVGKIEQSRPASRRAALRLVALLFTGSLLIAIAVALLSRRGYELGRLPIPPSWPRGLGGAVYPLALAVAFIVAYLTDRSARQGGPWRKRSAVFIHRLVLLVCVAAITFAVLSPNAVIALHFLDNLSFQTGAIQAGTITGGGVAAWLGVLTGGALLWLVPLTAVFAAFAVTACVRRPSEWLDRDGVAELLVLAWEAVAMAAIVALVSKARERFLHPVFPALVLTADLGAMALIDAAARWRRAGRPAAALAGMVVLSVGVVLPAAFAVASVHAGNGRDYSDIAGRPGYQVGAWLDARLPAGTSIMQNAGAYIPQRYAHATTLPYGDPFTSLAQAKPDIMVVNEKFQTDVDALPKHETDPVLMAEAGTVQDFYRELLSGGLGYTVVKRFAPTPTSAGFVILRADGGTSSGLP